VALTPPADDRDYPEALVRLVADVETRHFWFAARNAVILATLRRTLGALPGRRLLDVGCGTGFVLAALEAAGLDVTGIDMHASSLGLARARVRGSLVLSTATDLPFFADFDVVTLFDVIAHVEDDAGVLREAQRVLAPGGAVVVTVPAGPDLWTAYDEVTGHKRRYDREMLRRTIERAGLVPAHVGYFNVLPLLAQVLQRRLTAPKESGTGDVVSIVRQALRVPPAPINALLGLSVRLEAPLRALPWIRGGSLIAVATRGN
jgi:ubiquinone/menaquinone biosynthesis C-methylase UbiE